MDEREGVCEHEQKDVMQNLLVPLSVQSINNSEELVLCRCEVHSEVLNVSLVP